MRIRQHVNPLRSRFHAGLVDGPLALPPGEVEVELGCAEGEWLFARAAVRPDVVSVGVEIREELVPIINRRAADEGVKVVAVFANINKDLPVMFPEGSVARAFINFPDPWFKKKQHKRRIIEPGMRDAVARMLAPGGDLFFQSDYWPLALDALATFEDAAEFENRGGAWSFWKRGNPYGVRSRREEACEAAGDPIWRILYVRR